MNTAKTLMLMTAMTILVVLLGRLIGGSNGMIIAFGFAVLMNFGSYWFSDKIVLRMYKAQPLTESDAPELYRAVDRLAKQGSIPMPKLYLIPTHTPNAFATGRNPSHAAVAVTQGLLQRLGSDEVEGVLAHELAHVKNRDILISTIAATMAGAIMVIANMARWSAMLGGGGRNRDSGLAPLVGLLIATIVAPIAALMIQMAISRTREFQADATGASISGRPMSLANALLKLERDAIAAPLPANQATAHMFTISPLTGGGLAGLFRTHPSTGQRVAKLEEMQRQGLYRSF